MVVCTDVQNTDDDGQVYATGGFGTWLQFGTPLVEIGSSLDRFAIGAGTTGRPTRKDCPKPGLDWGGVFFGGPPFEANFIAEIWAQTCGDGITNGTDQCDGEACCNPDCTIAAAGTACSLTGTNPCEAPGTCDGTSAACPSVAAAGTPCSDAMGACDLPDVCDGTTNVCPDTKLPAGTTCGKEVAGECDVADTCDGMSNDCLNAVAILGTPCGKPVVGECDVADTCDGISKDCLNAVAAAGTVCGKPVTEPCDAAERCDGTSKECPAINAVAAAGLECRAAAGECDRAEVCDGTNKPCPPDEKVPAGTTCGKAISDQCDVADACDGMTDGCPNAVAAADAPCGNALFPNKGITEIGGESGWGGGSR
jgi:hypothetical protein